MLSFEDKLLIIFKGFFSRRLIKEFPNKNVKRRTLDDTAFVASDAPHFRRNKILLPRIGLVKQSSCCLV